MPGKALIKKLPNKKDGIELDEEFEKTGFRNVFNTKAKNQTLEMDRRDH